MRVSLGVRRSTRTDTISRVQPPGENLSRDPMSAIEAHLPDNRFVPVRARELAAALAQDAPRFGLNAALVEQIARALEDVIDQEAAAFEQDLIERYAPFNPDRDTLPPADVEAARTAPTCAELLARLDYLFNKANFERLSDVQIQEAVRMANSHGLRIRLRPDRIESLAVWVRGRDRVERRFLTWRHPLRGERRSLPVYRRLIVVARLRDDPNVLLKLFKEIPVADVEALLPHAEVQMNWLDRLKVFGGGAGMVGSSATRLFHYLGFLAYWSRIMWVLAIGGLILLIRTLMGYKTARTQRDWVRTRHLYYQNLDNNNGVIHALVSMVNQEECKEALLAYAACLAAAPPIASPDDLARRVQGWLRERFDVEVDYDVRDAMATLDRLGLWNDAATFHVLPPHAAIDRLRSHWRCRRTMFHHELYAARVATLERMTYVTIEMDEES